MIIYFQFLTQNQTVEAIELVRLIPALTSGQEFKGRVKVSAQAAVSRSKFADLESLIGRMAKKSFNLLEIVMDPIPKCVGWTSDRITSISGIFSPSPTSALWLRTRDWRIDADRRSRNSYMTAKTKEDVLDFHHISKEPSVLDLRLEIETESAQETVLNRCAEALVRSIPESLGKLHLFGCCDIVEPVFIPQLKTSVLMPERVQVLMNIKPPAYSELGERFEALHPLMFGSKRLCRGLGVALGKDVKLFAASDAKDLAVVRLSPACDMESAKKRAADWLMTGEDKLA
jgi:hypothetical protein